MVVDEYETQGAESGEFSYSRLCDERSISTRRLKASSTTTKWNYKQYASTRWQLSNLTSIESSHRRRRSQLPRPTVPPSVVDEEWRIKGQLRELQLRRPMNGQRVEAGNLGKTTPQKKGLRP